MFSNESAEFLSIGIPITPYIRFSMRIEKYRHSALLKCEVVAPAQRPFLYTHSATFRSESFNIRSVSSVPFSEKICPFDKFDLSALYATIQRSRSFESCIQVMLNISSLPFAFCSNRSVSNKICIRKAACADSFACFFNFEASVPVRIDDASITANVTG